MNDFKRIDLSNFDNRKEEISRDLMHAASEHGFFYGKNIIKFLLIFDLCQLYVIFTKVKNNWFNLSLSRKS